MGFALDETKERIVKYVGEHQDDEGYVLNQNKVVNALIPKGGSPNTFTDAFRELFDPTKDGRLQRIHVRKKIYRLALSENAEVLTEFKNKMKQVKNLIDLLVKFPKVGDCFEISKKDKIPKLTKYYQRELNLWERLIGYTINYHPVQNPPKAYCIQARYDLLRNLPIFLVNYVNDPANKFSKRVKEDAMKMIQPILFDCISKIQNDYSESLYYSDKFFEDKKITKISMVKGNPINDISAEFLRVLGRYYFSISHKFSRFKIDSLKEQKIISEFVKSFYTTSNLSNDKFSEKITMKLIKKYFIEIENLDKVVFTRTIIKRLQEAEKTLVWKFSKRYERYANNDPFIISNYYKEWIFSLRIFSPLEERIFEAHAEDSEEYEIESKHTDHDDPLEEVDYEKWKDFKGKLVRRHDGRPAIIPNKEYSEVEPYVNKWTRILIEEN